MINTHSDKIAEYVCSLVRRRRRRRCRLLDLKAPLTSLAAGLLRTRDALLRLPSPPPLPPPSQPPSPRKKKRARKTGRRATASGRRRRSAATTTSSGGGGCKEMHACAAALSAIAMLAARARLCAHVLLKKHTKATRRDYNRRNKTSNHKICVWEARAFYRCFSLHAFFCALFNCMRRNFCGSKF